MTREQIRLIELNHQRRQRVIGAWLVGGVIVDPGPTPCIPALLAGLDGLRPRALALTHIHLDHAGASGLLVERWPDLEVWVHEVGASHMAAPDRLLASAERLYGSDMERLWGEVRPVPDANIRILRGGERIDDFEVAYTPGHASHHVAYLHHQSGTAFVGDVGGVRIPPAEFVLPPTPPPDIDLEAWRESIATLLAWSPRRLALTHFGAIDDPAGHLETMQRELDWALGLASSEPDEASFSAAVHTRVLAASNADLASRYELAAPPDQCWQGLGRYLSKRELR
jgi:glyoxylase-like metal-dependent hydrolase (beta-lactamase superfamily II)